MDLMTFVIIAVMILVISGLLIWLSNNVDFFEDLIG